MGFIIGDALGVPLEFRKRDSFIDNKVVDMLGNGSHNVDKGTWSDDSSMVIATISSIINNNGIIEYKDIMNNFMLWADGNDFNINGYTFGIGRTTLNALKCYRYRDEFKEYNNPINCGQSNFKDNGNGSLMRILPIAYYCYYKKLNDNQVYCLIKNISSLTHKHEISILGCYIYVLFVINLLDGNSKENSYKYIREYNYERYFDNEIINYYNRILNNDISKLVLDDISSLGFVVDTLEAVIWCFMNNDNYKNCVIEAINLGNDTDTIGALVGGLSGIYYGDIPNKWLDGIAKKEYLLDLCNKYSDIL